MKVYNSITELIGNTPLLKLNRYQLDIKPVANLFCKIEAFNPAGSAKDRPALMMIEEAEKAGVLKAGSIIVEPTSGNTGIGLAMVARTRGYRVILTMPETMSDERKNLLRAYGAELVLTEGSKGMAGAIEKAEEIAATNENSFIAGQFINMNNVKAHYETTGPEIWQDLDGNIDVFVAGIGTGGTITGVATYLKEQNPAIEIIGVEPADSPVLSEGRAAAHKIQGIGANFVPEILNREIIDEIFPVEVEDAYEASRVLVENEGVLVGISAGAALYAATILAQSEAYAEKNIVVLLPDTGERYLSTELFNY